MTDHPLPRTTLTEAIEALSQPPRWQRAIDNVLKHIKPIRELDDMKTQK